MALSDELTKLAARAKQAEDRAAAAQREARTQLEQDVQQAHDDINKRVDQLREAAEANRGKLAKWWMEVQRSWNEMIKDVRRELDKAKHDHDVKHAKTRAESAEEDAEFAITYAYWAIEEAEYAVLDATLARMDADSLATSDA
jgi:hypothetical protein